MAERVHEHVRSVATAVAPTGWFRSTGRPQSEADARIEGDDTREHTPVTVEVFESSPCRATGADAETVGPVLKRVAGDLDWLTERGIQVARHDLAQDPAAFARIPAVRAVLAEMGTACLPLILVNGRIVSQAAYPTRWELAGWTGLGSKLSPQAFAGLLAALEKTIAAKKKSRCC